MRTLRLIGRGALLGLLAGLISVWVYVGLLGLAFMGFAWLAAAMNLFSQPAESAMLTLIAPTFAGLVMVCGGLLGGLPGALLGTLFGAVIGASLAATWRWLSPRRGAALGGVVTVVQVAVVHLWIITYDPPPTLREYFLLAAIPGLLAICAGAAVGWRLATVEQRTPPHNEASGE